MAHELSFSDCAAPRAHVVLGLPLRDFSIGHRSLLLRQRNPLVCSGESAFNALPLEQQIMWLIEAVHICAQTYAHLISLEKSPTRWQQWRHSRQLKRWHAMHRGYKADDWALAIAEFRNYLAAARVVTDFDSEGALPPANSPFLPCRRNPKSEGRAMGGPYDASLIQFLLTSRLCASAAEAMEYPFALAEIHYLTYLEREGALHISNAEEMELRAWAREMDEKAARDAGYSSIAEHIAAVTAQAKAEKLARAAETQNQTKEGA